VPIDVRVVAATNRDLRAEVNLGRFRADLFFRIAVLRIILPPLRDRPEDIPLLAERMLDRLGVASSSPLRSPAQLASLARCAWPGNVRELRNHLERCLVFEETVPFEEVPPSPAPTPTKAVDASVPYREARRRALAAFERSYAEAVLAAHDGRIGAAAAAARMTRVSLYRILKRHGV
jgi:DNA-binding NtrC family response regulator